MNTLLELFNPKAEEDERNRVIQANFQKLQLMAQAIGRNVAAAKNTGSTFSTPSAGVWHNFPSFDTQLTCSGGPVLIVCGLTVYEASGTPKVSLWIDKKLVSTRVLGLGGQQIVPLFWLGTPQRGNHLVEVKVMAGTGTLDVNAGGSNSDLYALEIF